MLNWDDLKFFLMVCRTGSIRAAAKELGVNHATVSRRINNFESSLGQRLFDRSAKGYARTAAGDEIYLEASNLEERLNSVERKVAGKDDKLVGEIRVTLPEIFAGPLLMPAFAEFCKLYPEVEIDIADSTEIFNLANRDADVAFRLCQEPPDYLVGRKLGVMHRACYMSVELAPMLEQEGWLETQNWIGWNDKIRRPVGKLAKEYPKFRSKHKIFNGGLQITACKHGMGVAILPCFIGDKDASLMRIPPYTSEGKHDMWILSHPDLRKNAKIQTFVRFMTEYMLEQKDSLEGRLPNTHCSFIN